MYFLLTFECLWYKDEKIILADPWCSLCAIFFGLRLHRAQMLIDLFHFKMCRHTCHMCRHCYSWWYTYVGSSVLEHCFWNLILLTVLLVFNKCLHLGQPLTSSDHAHMDTYVVVSTLRMWNSPCTYKLSFFLTLPSTQEVISARDKWRNSNMIALLCRLITQVILYQTTSFKTSTYLYLMIIQKIL